MRILLTNDDGMHAAQLVPLIRWLKTKFDVTVVVPKVEQSGKSHGIELHKPFEAKEVLLAPDIKVWAVDSTPADCVRFAVLGLELPFDLVVSGINRGFNIGADMMYSGTVGAAFEAVALGIPAVAISAPPEYYDGAVNHLEQIYAYFCANKLMDIHRLYNVNIPPQPQGIRITRQGGPYYSDKFPWVAPDMVKAHGHCVHVDQKDMTLDTDAALNGYISVSPLTINRVDMAVYERLKALNGD